MRPMEISAAVLAGGYSTRMGRDKASLPFGDGTLLTHQTRKLQSLGIEEVLISGTADGIPDVYPHRGPLSGIHACLLQAKHDAVLFLSVDAPLVPEEALLPLIEAHTGGVTLLEHDGEVEPLMGIYDRALAATCEGILQTERTSVRRLLDQAQVRRVSYTGDPALLFNCNTPEAYQKLLHANRPSSS